jgi:hypothetical protein
VTHKNCKRGLFNRLLCNFKPRYSERPMPDGVIARQVLNEMMGYDLEGVHKVYECDVCVSCGETSNRFK